MVMLQADWLRTVFTEYTSRESYVFPSTIGLDDGNLCALSIQVHNSIYMWRDTITRYTLVNPIRIVVK
jgi:hypothetical protein